MHTCPDCGQACYCSGDIEDHDTGEEFTEGCLHFHEPDCVGTEMPHDCDGDADPWG